MLRRAVLFLVLCFALGVVFPLSVSASDGCPKDNERHATADDAVVKDGTLPVRSCYDPNDATIGQNAEQAKQNLSGMVCKSGVDIAHLDAKFAVCAYRFMTLLRDSAPSACIGSAYRSPQAQLAACMGICGASSCPGKCAPPGASYHQKGLAVDVNQYNNDSLLLWQTGAQVGIYNPPGLHRSDAHHMQSQPNSSCAGIPVPAGDQGDYYNDTNHFFPPPAPPFDSQLRNMFLPPPPPPMQQQPLPSTPTATLTAPPQPAASSTPPLDTLNSTPYPAGTCAPRTYCSQSDGNIYYRATTCVDQKYQTCPKGCTGLICNATSTGATNAQPGGLSSTDITNNNSNGNSNANASSSFDLIDFFANPPATATNVGTATPIDISQLIQDTGNAATLQPPKNGTPIQTPPQGSPAGYGPVPQQTFTSADMANAPFGYGARSSTFQIALANMKATLLGILNYLQPFSGRIVAPQTYAE